MTSKRNDDTDTRGVVVMRWTTEGYVVIADAVRVRWASFWTC